MLWNVKCEMYMWNCGFVCHISHRVASNSQQWSSSLIYALFKCTMHTWSVNIGKFVRVNSSSISELAAAANYSNLIWCHFRTLDLYFVHFICVSMQTSNRVVAFIFVFKVTTSCLVWFNAMQERQKDCQFYVELFSTLLLFTVMQITANVNQRTHQSAFRTEFQWKCLTMLIMRFQAGKEVNRLQYTSGATVKPIISVKGKPPTFRFNHFVVTM